MDYLHSLAEEYSCSQKALENLSGVGVSYDAIEAMLELRMGMPVGEAKEPQGEFSYGALLAAYRALDDDLEEFRRLAGHVWEFRTELAWRGHGEGCRASRADRILYAGLQDFLHLEHMPCCGEIDLELEFEGTGQLFYQSRWS